MLNQKVIKHICDGILLPIASFKIRYLPIVILYFCYGFSTITTIAEMFWIKNHLAISNVEIIQIAFWAHMPWTLKLIFAQCIENISICGNKRKSYIIIGASLVLLGNIILIGVVNNHPYLPKYGSAFIWLLYSSFFINAGFVIQDLVADTLCGELVGTGQTKEVEKAELGIIQVIGRISLMSAILIASGIGGYLAEYYDFCVVAWIGLIAPVVSIIAGFIIDKNAVITPGIFKFKLLMFGVLLLATGLLSEALSIPCNQEIIFCVNLIVVVFLFKGMMSEHTLKIRKEILLIGIMVFFSRLNPQLGAGLSWWQIDVLQFDPQFLSILAQIGAVMGLVGTWVFSHYLLNKDIGYVIIILAIIQSILLLPEIGMSFGIHEWTESNFGFGARSIAIVDGAISSTINILMMAPILVLCLYFAPKTNKTSWLALSACFLNLPISAGVLVGQWLNQIFIIDRGQYDNVSSLLIANFSIVLFVPVITVLICNRYRKIDVI